MHTIVRTVLPALAVAGVGLALLAGSGPPIALAQTARVSPSARPAMTAQRAAPRLPVVTLEPCTEPSSQRCYSVRHDFTIVVPPRPEAAAARSAVSLLTDRLKGIADQIAALNQQVADVDAKIRATKDLTNALHAEIEATKDPNADEQTRKRHADAKAKLAAAEATLLQLSNQLKQLNTQIANATKTRADTEAALTQERAKLAAASAPADIVLTGAGFITTWSYPLDQAAASALFRSIPWAEQQELVRGCNLPNGFVVGKKHGLLKVFPDQAFFRCDPVRVAPGEVVLDGVGTALQSQSFTVNGVGTWEQALNLPNNVGAGEIAKASYKLAVTNHFKGNDGALTVAGYVESRGHARGQAQRRTYAFSHASIKVTGGADVARIDVDWAPSMTTGAGGSQSIAYDPVSLHVLGTNGKERRRDDLLSAVLETRGAGTTTHWRGDGEFSIDAEEAKLDVRLPSTLTPDRGGLKLAVKGGAVTQRSATGALQAHRLPALGARTRLATTAGAPSRGVALKSSKVLKLGVAVPRLQKGEKFELRLGGGGAHDGQN